MLNPPNPAPSEPDPRPVTLSPSQRAMVASVINLYRQGWFPMSDPDTGKTDWLQPTHRAVLPLDTFHVPRRLADRIRSRRFTIRCDTAFGSVIRACAEPTPKRPDTWINDEVIGIFDLLHAAGHAHSIEAWLPTPAGDVLVGGVYGVSIGAAFAGESMFSRPELGGTDASKVCLVHLVRHLSARGFELLDAQLANDHTAQFGLQEVSADEYVARLRRLSSQPRPWLPFGDYAAAT